MTHKYYAVYNSDNQQISSTQKSYTGDLELNGNQTLLAATNNQEFDIAIDVSAVKSILLLCDVACTIKTNSSGSPADTLVLKAGIAYIWNTDSYDTFKLGTDVTKFYTTVSGAVAGTLMIRGLVDASP